MPSQRLIRTQRGTTMDGVPHPFMAKKTSPDWLTQRRAAARSGLPYGTLRRLVRTGEFAAVRHGKGFLIATDALDAWLRQRGAQPRPEIVA